MKNLKIGAAALGLAMLCGAAQAALVDRGGGMIYDTTRNITWLADMNYAKTSGYDSDGQMNWSTAKAWAEGLSYGGHDDWRLPTTDSCLSFNCLGGELSGLFVTELGNKAKESVLNQTGDSARQIANLAMFKNVQSSIYWSGTESARSRDAVLSFYADTGGQDTAAKFIELYAMAVRPGDVAAVPELQTDALLLAGLCVVAVTMRRRTVLALSGSGGAAAA